MASINDTAMDASHELSQKQKPPDDLITTPGTPMDMETDTLPTIPTPQLGAQEETRSQPVDQRKDTTDETRFQDDGRTEMSEETGFPPDVLGSQVMVPSLGALAEALRLKEKDKRDAKLQKAPNNKKENKEPRVELNNNKAPRKNNQRKKLTWTRYENFNKLFGGEKDWAIYLVMTIENKINISQIERSLLRICPSEEMTVKKIRNEENKYLIKTTTEQQSRTYMTITELNNRKVTVEKHGEMNSVWGSILLTDLENNDESTYMDILNSRYKNVEEVKLIKVQRTNRKNLDILRIKFKGERLPAKVVLEGTNKEVRPFLPRPTQCYKCLKFGHVSKYCHSSISRCYKCGSPDHDPRTAKCENQEKCFNCNGEHHAKSNRCVFHEYHTQVKLLQIRSGMSVREAKLTLKGKGLEDPYKGKTYSQTTRQEEEPKRKAQEKTPPRSPKRLENQAISMEDKKSPQRNRFSILEAAEDIFNWEMSPPGIHLLEDPRKKRQREDSPTQNKICQKKANKETSEIRSDTEMDTTQEFTPERPKATTLKQKTRSMSEGLDKTGSPKRRNSKEKIHKSQSDVSESNDLLGVRNEMEKYKEAIANERMTSETSLHRVEIEASIHATQGSSSPINDDEKIRKRQAQEEEAAAADGFWEVSNNPDLTSLESMTPTPPTTQQRKDLELTQEDADKSTSEAKAAEASGEGRDPPLEGLKIHRPSCGCNSCFNEVMSKMKDITREKVKETVDLFRKQKNAPSTHLNPANLCRCVTHLNIKCKEYTWLEKLYTEIKEKEENRNRTKAKTEPQPRSSSKKRT